MIDVKVLEIDTDKSRISLSIKQVTDDPWENFSLNFKEGDIADEVVSKVVPFGAFVTLAGGVEGLVHVTEISLTEIKSPELELGIGQKVQIKLIEIDSDKRKVALSIKQADPEWKDEEDLEEKSVEMHSTQTKKDPQPQRQKVKGIDESLESILEELKERGIGSS